MVYSINSWSYGAYRGPNYGVNHVTSDRITGPMVYTMELNGCTHSIPHGVPHGVFNGNLNIWCTPWPEP